MKLRFIAVILLLAALLLVSCTPAANTSEDTASKTPSSDASSTPSDDDPLRDADYSGRTFTILQRTEHAYEFKNDETTIDFINDHIAERNNMVEERYGITINTVERDGDWGSHESFEQQAANEMMSGSNEYDLVAGYAVIMPQLTNKNVFLNWYDLGEYMNLDADWWYQDFIDQMTINGKLYMLSGDIALTMWEAMFGMFYNKDLVDTNPAVGNLYDAVRNDEWTYDKFLEVLRTVDPGDTSESDSKVYSYMTYYTTQVDLWQDAFNINVTEKAADGKPKFVIGTNQKMVTAVERIYELTKYSFTKYAGPNDTAVTSVENVATEFGKGKACFSPLSLTYGTKLAKNDVRFGILPMPKYDENQEEYTTTCQDNYTVFGVPYNRANDLEFIGTITEALCYYSNKLVVPAYYDTILKTRNTFDEDSADMVDIIRKGVRCNFGYLYSMALGWPAHQLNILIKNDSKEWVSNWDTNVGTFEANLAEQLETYYK